MLSVVNVSLLNWYMEMRCMWYLKSFIILETLVIIIICHPWKIISIICCSALINFSFSYYFLFLLKFCISIIQVECTFWIIEVISVSRVNQLQFSRRWISVRILKPLHPSVTMMENFNITNGTSTDKILEKNSSFNVK